MSGLERNARYLNNSVRHWYGSSEQSWVLWLVRLPSLWRPGPLNIGLNLFSRSCCSSVHIVFPFLPHWTLSTIQWLSYSSICDFHGFLSGLSNSPQTVLRSSFSPCETFLWYLISLPFLWVLLFLSMFLPVLPQAVRLPLRQATSVLMYLSWIALEYSLLSLAIFCWLSFFTRKTTYLVSYVGSQSLSLSFLAAWRETTVVSNMKGSLIFVVFLRWEQLRQILFVPQFITIFFWMKLPYYSNWKKYFYYHIFQAVLLYLNIFWCTVQ